MSVMPFDRRLGGWPRFRDFPQTESRWNRYTLQWAGRRRRTAGIGQMPLRAIEDLRAGNALAARRGWQEREDEGESY